MKGSGKTDLCIGLIEEAAIDNIPSIVIDPKGDICNLCLAFPKLNASSFKPWIEDSTKAQETSDLLKNSHKLKKQFILQKVQQR
ncbi:hypothetical protein [Sulfurimonas sp.]|uniref:hypothetical protein n=1 Tax=Sulfurimonas sp. TaxID=2022749 RepID=UPI0039E235BD